MSVERLKVGVLGLRRGSAHVRSMLALANVELVGVCDRLPLLRERAEALLAERGKKGTKVVSEYEELLELDLDAVVVSTHGKVQVDHSCQALESGRAVLSEVPGAATFEEIVRLQETVERTGGFYMLGETDCYADFLRYWRKWIDEGRFGPISLAEGEYVHYMPQSLHLPDGTRVAPSEARGRRDAQPIWRADQPPIQYLTHELGPLLEVLDDRVVSVTCRSGPWWSTEAPLRADGQFALFETAGGTMIRVLVTFNTNRPPEHRYRIFGTDGGAEWFAYEGFGRRFDRTRTSRDGWEMVDLSFGAQGADETHGHGGKDFAVAKSFVNALLQGRPSPIDVYRMAEYTLPGIVANKSAEAGGTPMRVPNLRRAARQAPFFWSEADVPTDEPRRGDYRSFRPSLL